MCDSHNKKHFHLFEIGRKVISNLFFDVLQFFSNWILQFEYLYTSWILCNCCIKPFDSPHMMETDSNSISFIDNTDEEELSPGAGILFL